MEINTSYLPHDGRLLCSALLMHKVMLLSDVYEDVREKGTLLVVISCKYEARNISHCRIHCFDYFDIAYKLTA